MPIDTNKPAEILLFDFLTDSVAAAVEGDVLFGIDVHDTIYQSIKKEMPRGVRISDAVGDMAPSHDGTVKEYNVNVQLVCFAKVEGKVKKERQDAMTAVWELEKEMYRLMFENPTLGGRGCDVLPQTGGRGYDVFNGEPYAVANIPLVINKASGPLT